MPLDLSSLEKAITALEDLAMKAEEPSVIDSLDETLREGIKAGVIQHFEFTYELCRKMLKRWLDVNIGKEAMLGNTQKELYRYGAEKGLLDDPTVWWRFHESRNQTSHTYDPETANEVYRVALEFIPHAKALYAILEARND
jgi:nucleotidyltransferase substrate binding protein (TIGR01987 family)